MSLTDTFELQIVTPNGEILKQPITYLRLPVDNGEIGVTQNHTESVAVLSSGRLSFDNGAGVETAFFVKEGVAHIKTDHVLILSPFIDTSDNIQLDRAERALKRANARLSKDNRDADVDKNRARASLKRAETRIAITSNP